MIKYIRITLLVLSIYSVNSAAEVDTCLPATDFTQETFDAVVESVSLGYSPIDNKSTYVCMIHLKDLSKNPMRDIALVPIIKNDQVSIISTNQICSYFSDLYKLDRALYIRACKPKKESLYYLMSVEYKRFL